MKKNKLSLHFLLNNNKFLIILSFIIAFGIWVTVSPQRERDITCHTTLSIENSLIGDGLEIVSGKEQNITVKISGKWYDISELSEDDISIAYSFSGITSAGKKEIAISATKANSTADFTIESVTPEKVNVTLDYISEKNYNIEVETNIKTKDGLIVGAPVVEDGKDKIKITASATNIKKLKRVVARINVDEELTETKSFNTDLKFLDKNNKEIDISEFTIPYTNVDVMVPINELKTVPVVASFDNTPDAFKTKDISYSISSPKVELIGTKEALEKIDRISLDPIDFTDITPSNNIFHLELNLPSGVSTSNGLNDITVKVNVENYATKRLNVSHINTVNVQKSVSASVETDYKYVTIVGPKNVIDKITRDDVYIVCDMSKYKAASGSVTVNGIVKSGKYKSIWGIGDCDIRVRIK